jgi:hypothetical protein
MTKNNPLRTSKYLVRLVFLDYFNIYPQNTSGMSPIKAPLATPTLNKRNPKRTYISIEIAAAGAVTPVTPHRS